MTEKQLINYHLTIPVGTQIVTLVEVRGGEVEANLIRLNEHFKLPFIPELIARKLTGPEHSALEDADIAFHQQEYTRLRVKLEDAYQSSKLPDAPSAKPALNDLLVRVRLNELGV